MPYCLLLRCLLWLRQHRLWCLKQGPSELYKCFCRFRAFVILGFHVLLQTVVVSMCFGASFEDSGRGHFMTFDIMGGQDIRCSLLG
jgi:hypothetical protein